MSDEVEQKSNAPAPGRFSSGDTNIAEPDTGSIQASITSGDFTAARQQTEALLATRPGHPELLYLHAVACRYLDDLEAALTSLRELVAVSPDHARAYQEQGHTLRRLGRQEQALSAYARACALNPALQASYRARIEILHALGRPEQAAPVQAQKRQLDGLPRPLIAVTDLISQGHLPRPRRPANQLRARVSL